MSKNGRHSGVCAFLTCASLKPLNYRLSMSRFHFWMPARSALFARRRHFLLFLLSISALVGCLDCIATPLGPRKRKLPCKWTAFNRRTTNYRAWKEQNTVCELLEHYDPAVRPLGHQLDMDKKGPVVVTTQLFVNSISAVSERNMEYVVQFRFQQQWFDDRLSFAHTETSRRQVEKHCTHAFGLIARSFFQNERSGHYHMLDQVNPTRQPVRESAFRRQGDSGRINMVAACLPFWHFRYPMDVQDCLFPDAYTTTDIIYKWDQVGVEIAKTANGALPNFEIADLQNHTCDSVTNTGTYSCLRVKLTLRRVFSFFLLQLYIPSAMLVGVSWVSYWIDWKSTAARVPLAIVTLLTMITQSHAINSNLPPVSYAKSIDIWVGGCVVFIFASLIEYAFVNYMGILDEHRQMRKIAANRTRLSNVLEANATQHGEFQPARKLRTEKRALLRKRRKLQLDLRYEEEGEEEQMELNDVTVGGSRQLQRDAFRETEPGWTMQDVGDMVYVGQRKRVELVRWCSLLSERGRAERIDIIARIVFPIAFALFNCVYWKIYLGEDYTRQK